MCQHERFDIDAWTYNNFTIYFLSSLFFQESYIALFNFADLLGSIIRVEDYEKESERIQSKANSLDEKIE